MPCQTVSPLIDSLTWRVPPALNHHWKGNVMGFLAFLLLGLIAGAIAKAILPGSQGGGWLVTLAVGVIGAFLGGWIGSVMFGGGLGDFFDLRTWILSILGAVIVLLIFGAINRRSRV
jgi:uncharacterized membrane protein YeaQ/YmgE (transglycosylase-associated protein family)